MKPNQSLKVLKSNAGTLVQQTASQLATFEVGFAPLIDTYF